MGPFAPHPGSWFGLPDFGLTEWAGKALGTPTTSQGGSDILFPQVAQTPPPPPPPPQRSWTNNQDLINWEKATRPGLYENPNNRSGMSDPASGNNPSTGGGGGGGGNPWDYLAKDWGSAAQAHYGDLQRQQEAQARAEQAARDAYNAQNSQLNTQYDQSAANINSQLPQLQNEYNKSLNDYQNVYGQAQNQYTTSQQNARQNTEQQINEAGNVAHETQNQNRNILRALGISGGTYAGELLSKPMTVYDQQRAQLNQALGTRMQELDSFLNQKAGEHTQAVNYLKTNYDNLVGKIQSDLRFNDRQRNDALQAANAALSQNLASIQSSMMNYQQQVQLQKQNFANDLMKIQAYTGAKFDPNAFATLNMSNSGWGQPQGVNIVGGVPQKRDQNNSLLSQG